MKLNSMEILTIVAIVLIVYTLKQLLLKALHSKIHDVSKFYKTKRLINTFAFLIVLIAVGFTLVGKSTSLTTFIGLFSAGVALAMKDILLNIAGWLYILLRQPFVVGDRIEIDSIKGDVIDQNLFKFRLIEVGNWVHADQSTGRIIHVPNSKIFTHSMANYTLGFDYIWEEIKVLITFESDWQKAKNLLTTLLLNITEDFTEDINKQIKNASKKYMIYYNNLTPIVYTDVKESGVEFSLRFICEPRKRRQFNEKIWESILECFAQEKDIQIAYPTIRRV